MSCTQSIAGPHPSCRTRPGPGTERRLRRALFAHLGRTLALWIGRARQRRDLAALDARMLRDIGVSEGAAIREAAKPFWVE